MRKTITQTLTADMLRRGMVFTDGKIVAKVARVTPMNLVGIVVKDDNGVRIEPTYTHTQIVTRAGNVINLRITDPVKVRAYVKL